MTGTKPKQLTLDYFAGRLLELKNDMQDGRVDPLVPLQGYIEEFTKLRREGREAESMLHEFVSTFTVLRELVECKVQAFKLLVLAFDHGGIKRFLQSSPDLDALAREAPWRHPFELQRASMPFMQLVQDGLGKIRASLQPIDDFVDVQEVPEMEWFLPSAMFTRELEHIIAYLHERPGEASINDILDAIACAFDMQRVKAFVMLLHLIQDGTVQVPDGDEAVTVVAVPAGGGAR